MNRSTSQPHFTVSTLNVLHALVPPSWPIIQPTKRYLEIAKIMLDSRASVFCLNECTQFFLDVVEPIVHDKYPYSTKLTILQRRHAVKIYSSLPFEEMFLMDWVVMVRVDLTEQDSVVVVASHLSHDERQAEKRSKQVLKICTILNEMRSDPNVLARTRATLMKGRIIFLGDLNLHLRGETAVLLRNGFLDCWVELKGDDVGYTWDPQVNGMINMVLPFDNRRMRLDRIAVSNGSDLKAESISIFANQKLEGSWYLYPSDHFGLEATFSIRPLPFTKPIYQHDLDRMENDTTTGFRTIRTISLMRLGLVTLISLGLFLLLI